MSSEQFFVSLLRVVSATAFLLALVLVPFLLFGDAVEARTRVEASGTAFGIAISGAAWLALDALLPVPSSIVATGLGTALGPWLGTLVNAIGLTASCVIGLFVGRSGSGLARRMLGDELHSRFIDWTGQYGLLAVVACRAVPVLAEMSFMALGAARARSGPVLAAAALADVALGAVYAFAGAAHGPSAAPGAPAFAAAILLPVAATLLVLLWVRQTRRARPPLIAHSKGSKGR